MYMPWRQSCNREQLRHSLRTCRHEQRCSTPPLPQQTIGSRHRVDHRQHAHLAEAHQGGSIGASLQASSRALRVTVQDASAFAPWLIGCMF